jgi:hypothetical protein
VWVPIAYLFKIPYKEFVFVWGRLPWIVGHHGHLDAARSHPKNVLGGAEERKINRVVVESIRRSICRNYHFIYFILFYFIYFLGRNSHPHLKKNGGGNYYTKDHFFFLEKNGPNSPHLWEIFFFWIRHI